MGKHAAGYSRSMKRPVQTRSIESAGEGRQHGWQHVPQCLSEQVARFWWVLNIGTGNSWDMRKVTSRGAGACVGTGAVSHCCCRICSDEAGGTCAGRSDTKAFSCTLCPTWTCTGGLKATTELELHRIHGAESHGCCEICSSRWNGARAGRSDTEAFSCPRCSKQKRTADLKLPQRSLRYVISWDSAELHAACRAEKMIAWQLWVPSEDLLGMAAVLKCSEVLAQLLAGLMGAMQAGGSAGQAERAVSAVRRLLAGAS